MSYVDEVIEAVVKKNPRRTGISSGRKRSPGIFKTGCRSKRRKISVKKHC